MDASRSLRAILLVAVGSAVYLALLSGIYSVAPYVDIPAWWSQRQPPGPVAVFAWFAIVNACGALLAAMPVAVVLAFRAKEQRVRMAMAIGIVPTLYLGIGWVLQYGPPSSAGAWLVCLAQLISVLFSVAVVIAVIGKRMELR